MAPTSNKGLYFTAIPTGIPEAGKHLQVQDHPIDLDQTPPEGGLLVKNLYVSFDPYQRGRMRDPAIKSYSPAFPVGSLLRNGAVARVLKSSNPKFKDGDLITLANGTGPTEQYSLLNGPFIEQAVKKLVNPHNVDPIHFVGALGMPGLTAYSSLYAIGKPKKGETIFISAASGAVGAIVGQLAKHEGLKVIGSVGDDAKLKYITEELGFDGGFNYKKEKPGDALKRLAPQGVDIYYENVGGEHLEAALNNMNDWGRIVACGMISQYNSKPSDYYGIKNLMMVVAKRLTIQGFIVSDPNMGPIYTAEHQDNVGKWIADGSFKAKSDVTDGIENAPEGLIGIFSGRNFGKAVLKIADP